MGCDSAILLTGQGFCGADTWATSRVLAEAIRRVGDVDLVFAGERATDGDYGPGRTRGGLMARHPCAHVRKFPGNRGRSPVCRRRPSSENHADSDPRPPAHRGGLSGTPGRPPCLVTVVKEIASPRLRLCAARNSPGARRLSAGEPGSLVWTRPARGLSARRPVSQRFFYPKVARNGQRIVAADEAGIEKAIGHIMALLKTGGSSARPRLWTAFVSPEPLASSPVSASPLGALRLQETSRGRVPKLQRPL